MKDYRTFDYSTNIIMPTKISNQNQYAPYQTIKQYSQYRSSKKITPSSQTCDNNLAYSNPQYSPHVNLNLKVFQRNKRHQKILSRNDRADLYLQGGQVLEAKKINVHKMINVMSKAQTSSGLRQHTIQNFFREQVFCKPVKDIKKPQIASSINNEYHSNKTSYQNWGSRPLGRSQRGKSSIVSAYYNKNSSSSNNKQDIMNNDKTQEQPFVIKAVQEQRKQSYQQSRKSLVNFISTQSEQSARGVGVVGGADTKQKQKQKQTPHRKKYNSVRNQIKTYIRITDSKTTIKSINTKKEQKIDTKLAESKIRRPLFYLEPKQISHIRADSFIVTEYPSGQIIMGNYFKKVAEIASLTKIMTFYTVYKIAEKYSKDIFTQLIEIDQEAQLMSGTSAQIFVGDVYTVLQLLYGLMLPSGNDAAIALAKWGGRIIMQSDNSEKSPTEKNPTPLKSFITQMNLLACSLGLKNTKFYNPHGLPNNLSGSNPEQMAILISECLNINVFKQIVKTKKYKCWVEHNGIKHEVIWQNTNKLLRRSNFIGVKTGVTISAGPCLATCYQLGSKIYIIVLLRTTKLSKRFKQTRMILALALSKMSHRQYKNEIRQIMKQDLDLDSDNSQDEQQFCYDRTDAKEMAKRNKILTYQI